MSLFKIIRSLSVSIPRCRPLLQSENLSKIARTSVGFQHTTFEPQILPTASFCTTNTENESVFMKLRGVPWKSSKTDIEDFFKGVQLQDIVFEYDGNYFTGRVYVQVSQNDVPTVMEKDRSYMGDRYIEVGEAKELDRISELQKSQTKSEKLASGDSACLKLQGTPYSTTKGDICEFLKGCQVEEILFDYTTSRRNGIAYVQIPKDDVETALAKDKEYIGDRYIKVHKIDSDRAAHIYHRLQGIEKRLEFLANLEKSNMTYVSLRGSPFNVKLNEIKKFLGVPTKEVLVKESESQSWNKDFIYCLINKKDLDEALKTNGAYIGHRYVTVEETPDHALNHVAFAKKMLS